MTSAFLNPLLIDEAVRRALDEDLGRAGDITTLATIPATATAVAVIAARKPGVLAGLPLAEAAFRVLRPACALRATASRTAPRSSRAASLADQRPGARHPVGERVALNFLGRLSGIATLTAHYVVRVAHTKARIVCTRKTTPGLRAFEKYAVRCGGGFNHRFGLDDAVLIKDNHIAVAGGIRPALRAAKAASAIW